MLTFSVVIPTYNRARIISESIKSVLAQTFSDFELIIVDDGSTDNTAEVVKGISDPRIRYLYKENGERGAARNHGLRNARARFAVFFDSDDWMKAHYLQTLKDVIDKNPAIFMLAAKYNFISGDGAQKTSGTIGLNEGWYGRDLFLKGNFLACNYCIRIAEGNFKFFPEERELASMEDWLFLLLNLENNKIYIRDEICVSMREHDERSMSNNQKVIEARKTALNWISSHTTFTDREKRILQGWSHYFCGIHQYLDNNRKDALSETRKAISNAGLNVKFLALYIKSMIGRKFISKLR